MKRLNKIVLIIAIILVISNTIFAHGGNITGWKDKKSDKIIESNGIYYGYHNKDGIRHYHQIKWNDKEEKWVIVDSNIYYDKNLNVTTFEELSKNNQKTEKVEVKLVDSIDGDTAEFDMDGKTIKVRFLAVDTPESVHPTKEVQAYGIEASNFTKEKLKNAKTIELEFDNNSDKTDKYNRYLAWIWIDGELLQNLLIKEGLAQVAYLYGDYKYTSILKESQEQAKEEKIGIWKDEITSNYSESENFIEEEKIEKENNVQEVNKKEYIDYIKAIAGTLFLIIIGILVKFVKNMFKIRIK